VPRKILAGDMWALHNFGDPNERYQAFLSNGKPRFQNFFDSTILYDEIVIPTDDFMSLAVLVGVLGAGPVSEMLDEGFLKLVRTKGALAYIGNGGGLHTYQIQSNDGNPLPFSANTEDALLWALRGLNNVDEKQAKTLTGIALRSVREVDISAEEASFREQTYADIFASSYMRENFGLVGDLSNLVGIGPKGVRIYGGPDSGSSNNDQIGALLKIAHANLEMRLADITGCSDVATGSPIGHLLRGKQDRARAHAAEAGKVTLKELADIPDIATWALEHRTQIDRILKLRSSSSGVAFREWFHKNIDRDNVSISKAYIDLLNEIHPLQTGVSRTIRFWPRLGGPFLSQ
jgi:hypothetical protein